VSARKLVFLAIKILFAASVLGWMTYTGRLNFTQIGGAFRQWPQMLAIVAIFYAQITLMTFRWHLLTKALGFNLGYRRAFSLSLIGLLFTVVLPGAVSGDIVKAYYLGKDVPNRRSEAFTTILMDRYLGLLSLLALGSVGVALNLDLISQNRMLATVATFAVVAFVGGTAVLVIAILISGVVSDWVKRLEQRVPKSGVLVRCLEAMQSYRSRPWALLWGLLISVPTHLLACLGIYIAMSTVQTPPISLHSFLFVVPLGLITTTIPLSPAGVGIGQAAFYTLFSVIAVGAGAPASNAFTVFQTLQLLVFLTGFFSYFAGSSVKVEVAEAASETA
jgi:uncharacterized protein (TIRG00374 family)